MRPKKVILCVDDDESVLGLRKYLLETRGYRVLCASSGDMALAMIGLDPIDLLLSDLVMPGMDGNELVRRSKAIAPDLPAILISGRVKSYDRAYAADAFLPKGAGAPVELLERIRILMARKRRPKKATIAAPVAAASA